MRCRTETAVVEQFKAYPRAEAEFRAALHFRLSQALLNMHAEINELLGQTYRLIDCKASILLSQVAKLITCNNKNRLASETQDSEEGI